MEHSIQTKSKINALTLAGILIAIGTILSFLKLSDLPFGGSVTCCSMVPVMLYSYYYGTQKGCFAGLTYGVLQLLFGVSALNGLSAPAVAFAVLFDYLFAFSALGLAGIFRNKIKNAATGFAIGTVVASFIRYIAHIISGTVVFGIYAEWFFGENGGIFGSWALSSLSGTGLSLFYSIVYNGLYMIPEMLVNFIAAFLIIRFAGKHLHKFVS